MIKLFRKDKKTDTPATTSIRLSQALAAEGYIVEAIDLLTQANRDCPDLLIEKRLVELRHEAYDLIKHPQGLPVWPPISQDLFGSSPGFPEITREEFTADTLRAGIQRHGALIVRGLFGDDVVLKLHEDVRLTFEAHDNYVGNQTNSRWYTPFEPRENYQFNDYTRDWARGAIFAVHSPKTMFDLTECVHDSGVFNTLGGYLGERPALSAKKTWLRIVSPTINAANGWHQDGAFLGDHIRSVNLWIALSPCGIDAPSMDFVPYQLDSLAPTGTEGASFDWSVSQTIIDKFYSKVPIVRPVFGPGDAILFDQRSLHRTGASPGMTKERYAIEAWFFAPSVYPLDQIPIYV